VWYPLPLWRTWRTWLAAMATGSYPWASCRSETARGGYVGPWELGSRTYASCRWIGYLALTHLRTHPSGRVHPRAINGEGARPASQCLLSDRTCVTASLVPFCRPTVEPSSARSVAGNSRRVFCRRDEKKARGYATTVGREGFNDRDCRRYEVRRAKVVDKVSNCERTAGKHLASRAEGYLRERQLPILLYVARVPHSVGC
jgi:hypothetical protein